MHHRPPTGLSCLPRQGLPPNGLQIGGVGDEFNLETSPPRAAKGNGMSAASKIDTVAQIYGRGGGRRPRHLLPGLPLNVKTNPSPVLLQNLNHQERQGQPRQLGMLEERGMGGRWVEGWVSEGCLSRRGSPCARPEHRFSLLSSTRPSTLVSQSQPSTSRCVDTEAGVWKSGPLPDVGVSIAEASISGE